MPDLITIHPQPQGTESHLRTTPTLDRRRWTLDFYTCAVDDSWLWDLKNDAQEVIVQGWGLTLGKDLLARIRYKDVPPGVLFVWDVGGQMRGRDPTEEAFREGWAKVYYLPST